MTSHAQKTTSENQEMFREYDELTNNMLKLKGGQLKGCSRNQGYEMYERMSVLHLEMVARGLVKEIELKSLGGKKNSEIITRGTIHRPEKKKLGKKKKGGRRRV